MDSNIKEATDIKYLGLKIDSKLTWSKHVEKVKSEIVKFASLFEMRRHFIHKNLPCFSLFQLVSARFRWFQRVLS